MRFLRKIFAPLDLTQGTPYKRLIRFAIPILLSTLLSNAFSLINALILKTTVGSDSVTAVNATGTISSILFNFAYGCTSGFAVIMANKKGKNDEEGQAKTFYTCLFLSLIIGALITTIGLLSYKKLLIVLHLEAYFIKASQYYQIILFSFIFMLLSNLMSNFVTCLGDSAISLVVSLAGTLVNVGLGFLFTGYIKLDTRGVALATLIANIFTFSLNLTYLYRNHKHLRPRKEFVKLDKSLAWECLKMGLPLGFQWSVLFIGSFYQQRRVNQFGVETIVVNGVEKTVGYATMAHTCYSSFESYMTIPLSVMSTALLHFVGQNYGAKNKQRIKQGIKAAIIIDICCYALILGIAMPLIDKVPYIFLSSQDINDRVMYYSSTYLRVLLPFLICQGMLQLSRSILQGVKKPMIPFASGLGELCARILVCAFIPSLINPSNPLSDESYLGLCFSTPAAWLVSVIVMGGAVIHFVVVKKLNIVDKVENKNLQILTKGL